MSLAFSPLQQRCLEALGYTLYALAGVGAEASATVSGLGSGNDEHQRDSNPYPDHTRAANTAKAAAATAAPAQPARDNRLMVAVLRAARVQIDTIPDPHAWLRAHGIDSIASLRRDPAAKRALWPTLRRERRAP